MVRRELRAICIILISHRRNLGQGGSEKKYLFYNPYSWNDKDDLSLLDIANVFKPGVLNRKDEIEYTTITTIARLTLPEFNATLILTVWYALVLDTKRQVYLMKNKNANLNESYIILSGASL